MSDQEIRILINQEILNCMQDASASYVLKNILYDEHNTIDWQNALVMALAFMPELQLKYKEVLQ
jgi:hypothetical protein